MASDSALFMRDCIQKKKPYSKVGCSVLVFKVSTKFFFFFFLEGHFSLTSTHFVSREKTRIKAREVP